MDLLSYVRIQSENYRGKNQVVVIYVWENNNIKVKQKQPRKSILSKLDLEPYYKCRVNIIDCAICINKIECNEYIRKLKCNHLFHKKCVDNWLKNNINSASCPMCRSVINKV